MILIKAFIVVIKSKREPRNIEIIKQTVDDVVANHRPLAYSAQTRWRYSRWRRTVTSIRRWTKWWIQRRIWRADRRRGSAPYRLQQPLLDSADADRELRARTRQEVVAWSGRRWRVPGCRLTVAGLRWPMGPALRTDRLQQRTWSVGTGAISASSRRSKRMGWTMRKAKIGH